MKTLALGFSEVVNNVSHAESRRIDISFSSSFNLHEKEISYMRVTI